MYKNQLYEQNYKSISIKTKPKKPIQESPKIVSEEVKKGGSIAEVKERPSKIRNSDKLKKFIEINL